MKPQVQKPINDKLHKQRVQSVTGTMAIDGLTLSKAADTTFTDMLAVR